MKDWPIKTLDVFLKNIKSILIILSLAGVSVHQSYGNADKSGKLETAQYTLKAITESVYARHQKLTIKPVDTGLEKRVKRLERYH